MFFEYFLALICERFLIFYVNPSSILPVKGISLLGDYLERIQSGLCILNWALSMTSSLISPIREYIVQSSAEISIRIAI